MKVADWLPDVGAEDGAPSEAGCWGDASRLALRLRHAGLGRMALDLALEVLLVFTVLKVPHLCINDRAWRSTWSWKCCWPSLC